MSSAMLRQGFTLLEILVSLSIIAVLSSVLYLSFDDARENSSNKAIMSEIKETQLALELYKAQNGSYPLPNTSCDSGMLIISADTAACGVSSYIGGNLVPNYIASTPIANDSRNSNCNIVYTTDNTGSWYKLTAVECIAGNQNISIDDEMARCPSSCSSCSGSAMNAAYQASAAFAKSFSVYSLGGQCN